MKQRLQKAWLARGWLSCLLWPLAQVHGLLVRLRLTLYRNSFFASARFSVPVVVVGNVVAGGAGKTPLVMALVKHWQGQGLQVGVVSRGHGRAGQSSLEVTPHTSVQASGDEPALIQRATGAPVFVARRRADAVRALLAAYPATQVVICDDGLQHYALQRDIEIAVFDDRGVGNGWLLPAGLLREPWPERQRQSMGQRQGINRHQGIDLVLHTGQKPAFAGFTSHRQLAEHALAADGRRIALADLRGQPLIALAGIANPEAFFAMLRARGLQLDKTLPFPDHHDFTANDLSACAGQNLSAIAGQTVLCTEKDAVKLFTLPALAGLELLAVPLAFSPEPAFFEALDTLLAPLLSGLPSRHGHKITSTAGLPRDQGPP